MALHVHHKSKLWVYKKLKRGVGFGEYLGYVKGAPSRLILDSQILYKHLWAV